MLKYSLMKPCRTSFAEIADRREMPYILGGSQRPVCKNCHEDHLWAHFCKFESQGPVCTEWDKWRLVDSFITRYFQYRALLAKIHIEGLMQDVHAIAL